LTLELSNLAPRARAAASARAGHADMSGTFTWNSAAATHVGYVRQVNEDALCERPDIGLWAVADGLGGHSSGDLASQMVVAGLMRLKSHSQLSLMVDFIEHSLLESNDRLTKLAAGQQTIGSTVVALTVVDAFAAYLWVGDSRLYRYRDGQLRQLTTDHSQVERYIEQGVLLRANAAAHPQGHLLTRAIGARQQLRVDVDVCALRSGDRFLLCSDGLDKHLTHGEIATLCEHGDAAALTATLLDLTLTRGAADNVTLCVVDIH
jgi:serine/threonine protein phosphatase PrpC